MDDAVPAVTLGIVVCRKVNLSERGAGRVHQRAQQGGQQVARLEPARPRSDLMGLDAGDRWHIGPDTGLARFHVCGGAVVGRLTAQQHCAVCHRAERALQPRGHVG